MPLGLGRHPHRAGGNPHRVGEVAVVNAEHLQALLDRAKADHPELVQAFADQVAANKALQDECIRLMVEANGGSKVHPRMVPLMRSAAQTGMAIGNV